MWYSVKKFYTGNLLVCKHKNQLLFLHWRWCTMDWIGNVRVLKYTHSVISYLHKSCCHIMKGWKGEGTDTYFWSSKNWSQRGGWTHKELGGWTHKEFAKSHPAPMGASSIAQSSQNNGFTQSKYNTHQQGQRDGLHTHTQKKNIPFQDHKVQICDG